MTVPVSRFAGALLVSIVVALPFRAESFTSSASSAWADTRVAFFLVLAADWRRELDPRPVKL